MQAIELPDSVSLADAVTPCELPPPVSRFRVVGFSVLALVAGIALAFGIERLSYSRQSGYLQARVATLVAGRDARIGEILVAPGDAVTPGQPLVRLLDPQLEEQVARQQALVESLEAELNQAEARLVVELEWRQKAIQAEIFETKLKSAEFLKQQFANQLENLAWERTIRDIDEHRPTGDLQHLAFETVTPEERRIAAMLRHEAAVNANEVSTAQVEMCEERLAQLTRLSTELPEQIRRSMGVTLVQSRLDAARQELATCQRAHDALLLKAQGHGIVGVFQRGAGEYVAPQDPIVQVLDEAQPFLVVAIPSSDIQNYQPGTEVALLFPGHVAGAGRVESIPPQTSPSQPADTDEPCVTVHIAPAGAEWPRLPFGSRVEVRRGRH